VVTHGGGFRAALTTLTTNTRSKAFSGEGRDLTGDDIREGLTAVISVKLEPEAIRRPGRDQAPNTEARRSSSAWVRTELGDGLDSHPNDDATSIRKSIQPPRPGWPPARHVKPPGARPLGGGGLPGQAVGLPVHQTPKESRSSSSRVTRPVARPRAVATRAPSDPAIRGKILNVERSGSTRFSQLRRCRRD